MKAYCFSLMMHVLKKIIVDGILVTLETRRKSIFIWVRNNGTYSFLDNKITGLNKDVGTKTIGFPFMNGFNRDYLILRR